MRVCRFRFLFGMANCIFGSSGIFVGTLLPPYQDRGKVNVTLFPLTVNASQGLGATDVDGEGQKGDFRRFHL